MVRGFLASLVALALVVSLPAQTIIDNEDGTHTIFQDDGSWQIIDQATGQVVDQGQEQQAADEPDFEGLGGEPQEAQPAAPESACRQVENLCEPSSFKQNGSRYFWLNYCPSPCGIDAYLRVREVIDPAWDFVSHHFGSDYSASDLNGYVYTTGAHYSDQSGGMPWSGGFFNPANNQIHLPAPLGRRGAALKSLLVHELTHFRLHKLTHNDALGGGGIQYFRFLNEGLAQQMEQRLLEDEPSPEAGPGKRQRNLALLGSAFAQGFEFEPLKDMMWKIQMPVPLFYAQSWAVVAYIEETYGWRKVTDLLTEIGKISRPKRTYNHLFKCIGDVFQAGLGVDPETVRAGAEAWAKEQARSAYGG